MWQSLFLKGQLVHLLQIELEHILTKNVKSEKKKGKKTKQI